MTVRAAPGPEALDRLPVNTVRADIRDRPSIRRAMRGIQRVFHLAGTTNLALSRERAFALNLEGGWIVLEEAPSREVEADEGNVWEAGRYRIPYVDSKHEAEMTAMRLTARGRW